MTQPPYAADTRAKGWRFEIDHERIRQSDTWALASADVRPWLLMLWMVAWEQAPCGSLPADSALIAARLGMAPKALEKNRAVLLRGWYEAEDGRLYHPVITERVLEMVDYREKAAARKAEYRERMQSSQGSPAVVPRDSTVKNDTGTGTGTGTLEEKEKKTRKRAPPRPEDVAEQVWNDWCELRAKKRATVSETVVSEARSEAAKAGMTLERFLSVWCRRGSQGLEAAWLKPDEAKSFRQADADAKAAEVRAWTGGQLDTLKNVIDMEAPRAAQIGNR